MTITGSRWRGWGSALALSTTVVVAACSKAPEPVEVVRPVRAAQLASVAAGSFDAPAYSGEVRPRIESRLGFRVPGKILKRHVDVGAVVRAGQLLASLDPRDLQLQSTSATAQLTAAETDRVVADADLKRYTELQRQGFISGAQLEQKQNVASAARARYDQAVANQKVQGNQADYASLVADIDGVVTAVDAEAGQVVAVGQSVVRIAQTRDRELALSVPEQAIGDIKRGQAATVSIWSRPDQPLKGIVREVSPAADAATRTYAVRVSLPDAPDAVRIGMTGSVRFGSGATGRSPPVAPLSALYRRGGTEGGNQASLWVIDPATMRVRLVDVKLGEPVGNAVSVEAGARTGDWIVTAGVNLLKPDQRVSILSDSISGTPPGSVPRPAS